MKSCYFHFRCYKCHCLYINFLAPLTSCVGAVSLTADAQEAGLTQRLGYHRLRLNLFIFSPDKTSCLPFFVLAVSVSGADSLSLKQIPPGFQSCRREARGCGGHLGPNNSIHRPSNTYFQSLSNHYLLLFSMLLIAEPFLK